MDRKPGDLEVPCSVICEGICHSPQKTVPGPWAKSPVRMFFEKDNRPTRSMQTGRLAHELMKSELQEGTMFSMDQPAHSMDPSQGLPESH